jgi:hypothetical protein
VANDWPSWDPNDTEDKNTPGSGPVPAPNPLTPSNALGVLAAAPLKPSAVNPLQSSPQDSTWRRMLQQESGNRQFRPDGSVVTSPTGAVGIAQVEPGTGPEAARLAGLPWDEGRLSSDAEYNQALGHAYYQHQLATFGSPALAAAAYNAGPGAVQKALAKAQNQGGSYLDYLPKETQNYVAITSGPGRSPSGPGQPNSGTGEGGTPGSITPVGSGPPGQNPALALLALRSMFPQHAITPIDYDPWKYLPKKSS